MRSIREILDQSSTIAVVGASTDPSKAAHAIPAALQRMGFTIIPVNPSGAEILGVTAVQSLAEVAAPIDIVCVFRPPAQTPAVAEQAVAVGARVLWLQLGIVSADAAQIASTGGLDVVMDKCPMVEAMTRGITKSADG